VLTVTPGSVVTPYRTYPQGVRVLRAGTSPRARRVVQAAFFRQGKLIRTLTGSGALRLFPIPKGRMGPGLSRSPYAPAARIEIASSSRVNGNADAVLHIGEPLVLSVTIVEPLNAPMELRVDGEGVTRFAAGSRAIQYTVSGATAHLGAHTVELLALAPNQPSFLASAQFIVPHEDNEDREHR
jgi:hypothetical protein